MFSGLMAGLHLKVLSRRVQRAVPPSWKRALQDDDIHRW